MFTVTVSLPSLTLQEIVNKCVKLQINVTDASAITVTKKVQNFDDMAKITVVDRFLKTLLMII